MPETRLIILGVVTAAVVLVIVIGSAVLALGDSFRELHSTQKEGQDEQPSAPPAPARTSKPARYTPERTRLRWYSPEILAVLLLTLAAGLWLARLVN